MLTPAFFVVVWLCFLAFPTFPQGAPDADEPRLLRATIFSPHRTAQNVGEEKEKSSGNKLAGDGLTSRTGEATLGQQIINKGDQTSAGGWKTLKSAILNRPTTEQWPPPRFRACACARASIPATLF